MQLGDLLLASMAILCAVYAVEVSSFIAPSHGSIKFGSAIIPTITRSGHSMFPSSTKSPINSESSLKAAAEGRKLVTMGRIPWKKLILSKNQRHEIISIVRSETHALDLSLMLSIAFFSQWVGKLLYQNIFRRFRKDVSYDESITKKVEENLSQAAKLGLVCYVFDAFEIVLEVAGLKGKKDWSTLAAKLMYATWIAFRLRVYKRQFFETAFEYASKIGPIKKNKKGKVEIVDKVTDFVLFGLLAFLWTDILQIKRGNALSSIFALGGAGTLALTLAMQDLAKRVINGLAISTSEVFTVGDKIQLQDGTTGNVVSVGWLSTELRGSDEIITKIPNTQLSNIRISNLSRLKRSQVLQSLTFKYDCLGDIPELCKEIKEEIAASCNEVITDGSATFRVSWAGYGTGGLDVVVDCTLKVPPKTGSYHAARQEVMEAIARVVKRKGIVFSPPTEVKLLGIGKDEEKNLVF